MALTPRTMQVLLIHSRFLLAALLVPAWKGIVVRGLEDPQQSPHSSPDLSPQQTSLDRFADGGPSVPLQQGPFPHHSPTSSGAAVGFGLSWHRHVVSQSSQPLPCCPGTDPEWRESSLLVPELTHFQPSALQDLSPTVSRPWVLLLGIVGFRVLFLQALENICPSLFHHPCCCAACKPVAPCLSSIAPPPAHGRTLSLGSTFSRRHQVSQQPERWSFSLLSLG